MKIFIFSIIIGFAIILQSCESRSTFAIMQSTEGYPEVQMLIADTTYIEPYGYGNVSFYPERPGRFIYYHRNDGSIDTQFLKIESTVIPGVIINKKEDEIFIVIDQKPLDSILGNYVTKENIWRQIWTPQGYKLTKLECLFEREFSTGNRAADVENVKKSPIHNFWIINKKSCEIYGPFSLQELKKHMEILGMNEQ
ncbi:MAG: hypothetical protein ACTTJH_08350 [Bacteroidales bacterium]